MLLEIFIFILAYFSTTDAGNLKKLKLEYKWPKVTYEWPSEKIRQYALQTGYYIPENNFMQSVAIWKDKLFITVPRWHYGVPSSLNYISLNGTINDPPLIPYPSLKANFVTSKGAKPILKGLKSGKVMVSAHGLWVDNCARLWTIDNGRVDRLNTNQYITKPAVVIFDLNSDDLVRRVEFNTTILSPESSLENIIVEVDPDDCDKAYAYMTDPHNYGLVVYDYEQNRVWRVECLFFRFDPLYVNIPIGESEVIWKGGISSIALSKPLLDGTRELYFQPVSSIRQFKVLNEVLKNEQQSTKEQVMYHRVVNVGARSPQSQAHVSFYDEVTSIIFYTQLTTQSIACWNTLKTLGNDTYVPDILHDNGTAVSIPTDVKVDENRNLWIVFNHYVDRKGTKTTSTPKVINKIISYPVDLAIDKTACV